MYYVVIRTRGGNTPGAMTWTSFKDKVAFNAWNNEKMRSWYEVVEEGVTQKRAIELCSSLEATMALVQCFVHDARRLAEAEDVLAIIKPA